jgi:hypothetical protein
MKKSKETSAVRNVAAEAAEQFIGAVVKSIGGATGGAGSAILFPHGITKINVSATVSGVSVAIDIEGPQSGTAALRARFVDAGNSVKFTINQRNGKKAHGTLTWPSKGLSSSVVSGDSGHDAINVGTWTGIAFQERPNDTPYCDASGNCWFSVFQDAYGRTGMGIHPDGGAPDATAGCIGLSDGDTSAWHDALNAVGGVIICEVVDESTKRRPAAKPRRATTAKVTFQNTSAAQHVYTISDDVLGQNVVQNKPLDVDESVTLNLVVDENRFGQATYGYRGGVDTKAPDLRDGDTVRMD